MIIFSVKNFLKGFFMVHKNRRIDKKHFGGNSWHTPYGPICLHEQYIGEMGLAINDPF